MSHTIKPESIASNTLTQPTMLTCEGVSYNTNRFGDIFPQWQSIPEQELTETLVRFVGALKHQQAPFIIEIPHDRASAIPHIRGAGFTFHCGDNEKTVWIIINGSPIPCPYTATGNTLIMVLDQDKILVIEEKTRPGILGFPAGNADPNEFIKHTAVRELYEEVGLVAQPEQLKLIGLVNRLNVNPQGASSYTYCYLLLKEHASGEVAIDTNEIIRALWVPLDTLRSQATIEGLKVTPFINKLADHLYHRCAHTQQLTVIDDLQLTATTQDTRDIMYAELFAQDLR